MQQQLSTQATNNEVTQITQQKQIHQNLQQKLYQNIERFLHKEQKYYGRQSLKYYTKTLSTKQLSEQTTKYINHLKQNINPLPVQHQQQLSFLIDIFNRSNKCIINSYRISENFPSRTFYLGLNQVKQRIDLKLFLNFNNWNNLVFLMFNYCEWFNDGDWRALVGHVDNFSNLRELGLFGNKIKEIKEGDIERFKSMKLVDLSKLLITAIGENPLSQQSKKVLRSIKQKNETIEIYFDL